MTVFTLEVPLPTIGAAANGRANRWGKAKEVGAYKSLVFHAAIARRLELGWKAPDRARICLAYCTKGRGSGDGRYRPTDWDNAVGAFKAGQDALVLAGVHSGDDYKDLEGGSVTFDNKAGPHVRVTIERLS